MTLIREIKVLRFIGMILSVVKQTWEKQEKALPLGELARERLRGQGR
jgi:hypothetical protein